MKEKLSVGRLLEHLLRELEMSSTVFGVAPGFRGGQGGVDTPEGRAESALGVAAGPYTQSARGLAAGYVAGARVFELSSPWDPLGEGTHIQTRVGRATLYRTAAKDAPWESRRDETVTGVFLIRLLARELGLGDPNGAVFLADVFGAKEVLAGRYAPYLDDLADASSLAGWQACREAALEHLDLANNLDRTYVEGISPCITRWVSVVPQAGDTPEELAAACRALLDRGRSVSIKLDGGFLGRDRLRALLERVGGGYEVEENRCFLTWAQVRETVRELRDYAAQRGLSFGLNISGAVPVTEKMWLTSPVSRLVGLSLAAEVAADVPQTPIPYAGGADAFHVTALASAGLGPVLVGSGLLKPGGFARLKQLAKAASAAEAAPYPAPEELRSLFEKALEETAGEMAVPFPWKKLPGKAPMLDCFTAPCSGGCPFGLDVTGYLRLMSDGRFRDALQVILDRDPLPNITGAICPAPCQSHCLRLFYDEAVDIPGSEGHCARTAWRDVLSRLEPAPPLVGQRVAVIGGGPAGMAAAFLLARRGVPVTLFEQGDKLGGAVARYIPEFRVSRRDVERDAQLLELMGVDIRLHTRVQSAREVLQKGYSHALVAIGASVPALAAVEGKQPVDARTYLARCKEDFLAFREGKTVMVLGDGDAAMDAARTALRQGCTVTVVSAAPPHRWHAQDKTYQAAKAEGVRFLSGYRAVAWDGETVTLKEIHRGERAQTPGEGGAAPDDQTAPLAETPTGHLVTEPAQLVVAALGSAVDGGELTRHGARMLENGLPALGDALETETPGVYVLGDACHGQGDVAQAIADAHRVVDAILGKTSPYPHTAGRRGSAMGKKGKLARKSGVQAECERCLGCSTVCEGCVDVCPARANLPISVPTRRKPQILHLDALCQGCGVCAGACPFETRPFLEKFTLFETLDRFEGSENPGFVVVDFLSRKVRVRLNGQVRDVSLRRVECDLPGEVRELMETIFIDYPYLLDPLRRKQEEQLRLWE